MEDTIIEEPEINATLLEPTTLPQVATVPPPPIPVADYNALQRTVSWTTLNTVRLAF
ncbi:MAG: hypothetical protein DSM106950_13510 [Stigonema ocellatum SAG 48.90 = DSM 106950]|nr:hypothetical protein [Stigonema ocellatum SAG 48.90 = DSM 106950]